MPTRREALATLGLSTLAACTTPPPPRPNVLFVMTDDQTWQQMSCAGHPLLKTPNMDRLAHEGAHFRNAFCTNSLCAPGRASVLTGCYSHVHGIRGNSEKRDAVEQLDPDLPTFPSLLQAAGYRTGLMGKWHIRQDPAGFDKWTVLPGQGVYFDPEFLHNGEPKEHTGYATEITTDLALDFLADTGEDPWCLVYQHKAPHRPFTPPPHLKDLWANVDWPKPASYNDDYATRPLAAKAEDMRFEISLRPDYEGEIPENLSPDEEREWIFDRFVKDHHRSIAGVDEQLGRVLNYLDESGQTEDTLVIYTTDNGYFLGEHGWYDKRFMYEPSLRIPLLIRYPRLGFAGLTPEAMVLNIDLAPTIVDLCGLDVPAEMQGQSLAPFLRVEQPADWRESIFYAYYDNSFRLFDLAREDMTDPTFQFLTAHRVTPHRGVRTNRYKLIEYYMEDYWELFDLEEDPQELTNLYNNPTHTETQAQLIQQLRSLQHQYNEPA